MDGAFWKALVFGAALADLIHALLAFSIGAVLLPVLADHATVIRTACALLLTGWTASARAA